MSGTPFSAASGTGNSTASAGNGRRTPALLLSEGWVSKGVAISILTAVDRSSVALFVLILVVCALFVANSATAAVRGRRTELGVLTCLGWTRPRVFATVLGEVTLIGLTAGILGALAVADAWLISIAERAPELATLRAFGWPEAALRRMVITEGALTGLAGSVAGAALGLAGAAIFARQLPPRLLVAAGAAVAAGVLVTCLAALLPAHLLRRLPAAQLLAQE